MVLNTRCMCVVETDRENNDGKMHAKIYVSYVGYVKHRWISMSAIVYVCVCVCVSHQRSHEHWIHLEFMQMTFSSYNSGIIRAAIFSFSSVSTFMRLSPKIRMTFREHTYLEYIKMSIRIIVMLLSRQQREFDKFLLLKNL